MTETRQYENTDNKLKKKVALGNRGPDKKIILEFKSFEVWSAIIRTIKRFAGGILVEH